MGKGGDGYKHHLLHGGVKTGLGAIAFQNRQVIIKPSNNLCESEGASPMKFRKNPVEIVSVALCVVTALFSLVTIGYVMIA